MSKAEENLIGIGLYTIPESARLAGVDPRKVRRWVEGYRVIRHGQPQRYQAVWNAELELINGFRSLSFLDLIEIRFVDAFRKAGVRWKVIREAAEKAMGLLHEDHPFSTKRFRSDGKTIFAEIEKTLGGRGLLDLPRGQFSFEEILSDRLYVSLEFSDEDMVRRWWPMGKERQVVLDPERSFGKPIVAREGIPTSILASAYRAEKSISRVARWYEVEEESARDAVEYEEKLAA